MSKFRVGDKVVFNREKAKKDIDLLVPGADSWLDSVPKGPLTIKEAVGSVTVLVEECHFWFSPDWFDKYEEPVRCEVKFTLGDKIKDVKFSGPATIVFWTDGTKTVVKCRKGDKFDPEKGIAMACAKKLLGNEDGYHKNIEKYLTKSKTPSGGIESMDTEKIRGAVMAGCHLFPIDECATKCPCGIDGTCCLIYKGTRDQLIKMLKSFEKAGYFSYEDWRMHHA